ncbi:MAG: hypothetical protein LBF22_10965 [Deltaproteobacteria bacterium]|nr:hypothetical protein [Deltaproteobacteria bacterium]
MDIEKDFPENFLPHKDLFPEVDLELLEEEDYFFPPPRTGGTALGVKPADKIREKPEKVGQTAKGVPPQGSNHGVSPTAQFALNLNKKHASTPPSFLNSVGLPEAQRQSPEKNPEPGAQKPPASQKSQITTTPQPFATATPVQATLKNPPKVAASPIIKNPVKVLEPAKSQAPLETRNIHKERVAVATKPALPQAQAGTPQTFPKEKTHTKGIIIRIRDFGAFFPYFSFVPRPGNLWPANPQAWAVVSPEALWGRFLYSGQKTESQVQSSQVQASKLKSNLAPHKDPLRPKRGLKSFFFKTSRGINILTTVLLGILFFLLLAMVSLRWFIGEYGVVPEIPGPFVELNTPIIMGTDYPPGVLPTAASLRHEDPTMPSANMGENAKSVFELFPEAAPGQVLDFSPVSLEIPPNSALFLNTIVPPVAEKKSKQVVRTVPVRTPASAASAATPAPGAAPTNTAQKNSPNTSPDNSKNSDNSDNWDSLVPVTIFTPLELALPSPRAGVTSPPSKASYPPSAGEASSGETSLFGTAPAEELNSSSPLTKKDLALYLGQNPLKMNSAGIIEFTGPNGRTFFAQTTFDPALQQQVEKWITQVGAGEAALVVLNPTDGRILALAGTGTNPGGAAVLGGVPAASLFKIVTAAASMEKNNYDEDSYVLYDGGKHTLFKTNVVKEPDQGLHKATLRLGFAESINSVFGKLGIYTVGPEDLAVYAERLKFNQELPFEIQVAPSAFQINDPTDDFHLAELASGYNRLTTMSPLHAAMVAGTVWAGGLIYEPWMVVEVKDEFHNLFYRGGPSLGGRALIPETTRKLKVLMEATIHEGTGRRRFSDAATHPLLSQLHLGGKSGTINDDSGQRVDWFVAFASPKKWGVKEPLAIAAVVVHNGRYRLTSQDLVRGVIIRYYEDILGKKGQLIS